MNAPLTPIDLLLGVRNIPLRIVERHWVEVCGMPDLLWIYLSDGSNYSVTYDAECGIHRIFVRDTLEVGDEALGLPLAEVKALGAEVYRRYAENQAGVR